MLPLSRIFKKTNKLRTEQRATRNLNNKLTSGKCRKIATSWVIGSECILAGQKGDRKWEIGARTLRRDSCQRDRAGIALHTGHACMHTCMTHTHTHRMAWRHITSHRATSRHTNWYHMRKHTHYTHMLHAIQTYIYACTRSRHTYVHNVPTCIHTYMHHIRSHHTTLHHNRSHTYIALHPYITCIHIIPYLVRAYLACATLRT